MPSGMVGSSKSSCASTGTLAALGFLGDTYGGSKFFSSSVNSTSGGDGGRETRSALWDLGIFARGPKEARRSALDGALVTNTCSPAGCASDQVASTYVNWPLPVASVVAFVVPSA